MVVTLVVSVANLGGGGQLPPPPVINAYGVVNLSFFPEFKKITYDREFSKVHLKAYETYKKKMYHYFILKKLYFWNLLKSKFYQHNTPNAPKYTISVKFHARGFDTRACRFATCNSPKLQNMLAPLENPANTHEYSSITMWIGLLQ